MRLNNLFKTLFGKKETQPEIIKQVNIEPITPPLVTQPIVTKLTETKPTETKKVTKKEVCVPQEPVTKKLRNKTKIPVIKQLKK